MSRPLFDHVTIVGLGLIGGSLGMALRERKVARKVFGIARSANTLREAKRRGAVDDGSTDLADGLSNPGLVVIATPPKTVVGIAHEIARRTRHSFILTDVASVKGEIVGNLEKILPPRISFVGGHPMAGSERSRIQAANPDLFQRAPCVVTKSPKTSSTALATVSALWRSVGGRVTILSPSRHDLLIAQISHLPHVVAVGLTHLVSGDALKIAAGGFRDATRIALSDPDLWSEICQMNRVKIAHLLDQFVKELRTLRRFVAGNKGSRMRQLLHSAREKRSRLR